MLSIESLITAAEKLACRTLRCVGLRNEKWEAMQFYKGVIWDFASGKIKYFQFGVWSVSHNCLHKILRNKTCCGYY